MPDDVAPGMKVSFSEHLKSSVVEITPRPLKPEEEALLRFVLNASGEAFAGQQELQAQISHARVIAEVESGNPTIYLHVDRGQCVPARVKARVPVEAHWVGGDGHPCEVLVHVVRGYLAEVELYCYGDAPLRCLPSLEQLSIFIAEG